MTVTSEAIRMKLRIIPAKLIKIGAVKDSFLPLCCIWFPFLRTNCRGRMGSYTAISYIGLCREIIVYRCSYGYLTHV